MSSHTVLLLTFIFYYNFSLLPSTVAQTVPTEQQEKHCGEYGFRCVNIREYEICSIPSEQEANEAETPLITRSCVEGMICDEENPSFCSPPEQCDLMKSKRYVVDDLMSVKNKNDDYKIEDEYVYSDRRLDNNDATDHYNDIYRVHDDINLNFIDMDDGINEWELEDTITTSTETTDDFCKRMDLDIAKMFSTPHDCEQIAYFPGKFLSLFRGTSIRLNFLEF